MKRRERQMLTAIVLVRERVRSMRVYNYRGTRQTAGDRSALWTHGAHDEWEVLGREEREEYVQRKRGLME